MTSWQRQTFKKAGIALLDCDHKTPAAQEMGRPYVGIPQMTTGRVDFTTARRITEADFVTWTRKTKYQTDDVILSRRTNPGVTAIHDVETEFALGQNLVLLRADGQFVYPPFLRWLVRTDEWWTEIGKYINVGAIFSSLRCGDVPNFELTIPPLNDQKNIEQILRAFDDKIEVNRRMNAVLEGMARAVFVDWFVDFGPTRRKMAGEADPVKILGGAISPPAQAQKTAALFPGRLGENGLPEGWEEKPLDEIAVFLNGLALQKFPAVDGEDSLPVLKIAELRNGISAKTNRASRSVPAKYVIQNRDFIFSWSGSLLAKFWTGGECALNQHLFKVTSDDYPAWFFGAWVEFHLAEFQRIAAGKAVTMGHIKRSHLKEAMTSCPSLQDICIFGETIKPLIEKSLQNDLENQTLAETRDLLLPKLMSGEIRLREGG